MGLSGSTPSYSEKVQKDIDSAIASGPLVLFSASYCPYCRRVKEILKPYSPYTIIEVDEIGGNSTMSEYKAYLSVVTGASRITWPRVFIGAQCIGGCDDTTKLKNNGQLDKLINDAKKKYNESSKL